MILPQTNLSGVHVGTPNLKRDIIKIHKYAEFVPVLLLSIITLILCEGSHYMDQARPRISGMALVAEHPHNKHGSSVFIRDGLKANNISVCEEENVEIITVELPGVVVHCMYKPPPEPFRLPALGQRNKPYIVIGDFNSHSTLWAYSTTNSEQWADSNSLSLIHNVRNWFWIPSRAHSITLYV